MTYQAPADIYETETQIAISLEIPGYNKDSINIDLEKNVLSITADSKREQRDELQTLHREFTSRGFNRSFTLSSSIDKANITASSENGVLTVLLPKTPEQQSRKITVQ